MTREEFQNDIRAGIPDRLPAAKPYDRQINHAPKRKEILSAEGQVLAAGDGVPGAVSRSAGVAVEGESVKLGF